MQHDKVFEHLHLRYENEGSVAISEFVLYCESKGLDWPKWLRTALAKACKRYLADSSISFAGAFFAHPSVGGPNPARKASTKMRHQAVRAADRGAQMAGYKEGRRMQATAQIYDNIYPNRPYEPATMENIRREQERIERLDPDRLQSPLITAAGEADDFVTSTDNAITASGILAQLPTARAPDPTTGGLDWQ